MNIISLLSPYLRIMTLRSGPQDVPYSSSLLMRILLIYLFTGMLVLLPGSSDLFVSITLLLMDLVMLLLFIKFCLYTRNTQARFVQTFSACLGVGIIFQILALPLVILLNTGEPSQANNMLGGIVYLVLVSWQVTVMAHILKHAMNMLVSLTLLLSFSYFLLIIFFSNKIVEWLSATAVNG